MDVQGMQTMHVRPGDVAAQVRVHKSVSGPYQKIKLPRHARDDAFAGAQNDATTANSTSAASKGTLTSQG
jgi:hypothetical protein